MEVLRTKHLDARPPSAASLDTFLDRPPELVSVDITNDTVTEVAGRLSLGAGTRGAVLVILQHWLLSFGEASNEFRLTVADFTEWLVNGRLPWDTYRALMSVGLIELDKQSWVRLVGVG